MSDSKSSNSVPPFTTKLPPEFIDGLDERGRYTYTKLDEIGQAMSWLMQEKIAQSTVLGEIKEKVTETNGRLLKAEAQIDTTIMPAIASLRSDVDAAHKDLRIVRFAEKALKNKWFWAGTVTFLIVGVPFLAAHAPAPAVFFQWMSTLLGG